MSSKLLNLVYSMHERLIIATDANHILLLGAAASRMGWSLRAMPMEPPIFNFRSRNACSTNWEHELPGQSLISTGDEPRQSRTSILTQAVFRSLVSEEAVSALQQHDAPAGVPACP